MGQLIDLLTTTCKMSIGDTAKDNLKTEAEFGKHVMLVYDILITSLKCLSYLTTSFLPMIM